MASPYELTLRNEGIARAFAGGAQKEQLCRAHDLTPAALNAILNDPGTQDRIDHWRSRLQVAAQLNAQFIEAIAPKALRNVEAILDDSNHRDWAKVSLEVAKMALPAAQQQAGELGLRLEASPETMERLANALHSAIGSRAAQPAPVSIDHDPRLVDR